jgi:sigma-B regulation protein RsbU (phosphoserine phosphatase)
MRVLIADDDPVSLHLLSRTLVGWGYEVTTARDGNEAWRLFEERDHPLVILDWVMPGLDGLELVRRIRAARSGVASAHRGYVYTILLTAHTHKGETVEGLAAGADEFVTKPFDRDELRVRLCTGERILRLEHTLVEQNRILREHNEEMVADLRMACEVQQALLPQGYPNFPGHVPPERSRLRFCDRYRPNGAVGGDFFDVLALSDDRAGLFICDVMGHGVRAALVTAMIRALLQGARSVADDVGRLLAEVNRELLAILGQASVPVFLSAFYAVVDVTTGQLRYANAGHPAPLLVRRSEGTVEPLSPTGCLPGPPLGVRDQASYSVSSVSLVRGDLLVLFTDGVYEATAPDQEPYGEERLRLAVERRLRLPTGRIFDEVLAEVQQYTAGRGFADDVCLVGMELTADPDPVFRPDQG